MTDPKRSPIAALLKELSSELDDLPNAGNLAIAITDLDPSAVLWFKLKLEAAIAAQVEVFEASKRPAVNNILAARNLTIEGCIRKLKGEP